MPRLPASGQISVSQINTIRGVPPATNNTNIKDVEITFMGGSGTPRKAVSNSVGAFCFPNQVEKVGTFDWTYNPPAGFTSSDFWKSSRLSEFRNSYNDYPSVSVAGVATGQDASGTINYGAIRCTGSTPNGNIPTYSFYLQLQSGGGSWTAGWYFGSPGSGGTSVDIPISSNGTSTWKAWVRDGNGCGQSFEFISAGTATYP
jgi:hypothetical protein